MLEGLTVGFVGGGRMCEAIVKGCLASGEMAPGQFSVADVDESRLAYLQKTYAIATEANGEDNGGARTIAEISDVLVLAVKPQYMRPALAGLDKMLKPGATVLSIVGGVPLATLQGLFPASAVVRAMPNTPMEVRKGAVGLAAGQKAAKADLERAKALFALVGTVHVLPESLMDSLTAVSGCGPAFAYLFIEALADGGVEQGLPRAMAQQLAAQALAGAAAMVLETGKHPAALKDAVSSPGGGTIAGVHALEGGAFRGDVMNAVAAAAARMAALGKQS